jgi:hypothetical protein
MIQYNNSIIYENTRLAREKGLKFESKIQNVLETTKYKVLTEHQVTSTFGISITAIDHLLYTDNIYFAFQDKWTKSKPSVDQIHHFIHCVNNVYEKTNKQIIGIYLSKNILSKPSQQSFDCINNNNNNINKKIRFFSIHNNNNDDDCSLLLHKLMELLYSYDINYYDNDDSIKMFDPENIYNI